MNRDKGMCVFDSATSYTEKQSVTNYNFSFFISSLLIFNKLNRDRSTLCVYGLVYQPHNVFVILYYI